MHFILPDINKSYTAFSLPNSNKLYPFLLHLFFKLMITNDVQYVSSPHSVYQPMQLLALNIFILFSCTIGGTLFFPLFLFYFLYLSSGYCHSFIQHVIICLICCIVCVHALQHGWLAISQTCFSLVSYLSNLTTTGRPVTGTNL